MTANATLARPYSKAAFEYALQHQQVAEWAEMLQMAVEVNPPALRATPFSKGGAVVPPFEKGGLGGISSQAISHFENFLQLLGINRRLNVLPEIADLYEQYRAAHEKRADIKVTSAFPLSAQEKTKLESSLKTHLKQDVVLLCDTDPHLLGGAIIRIGDQVIDGSVRGALTRLGKTLCN